MKLILRNGVEITGKTTKSYTKEAQHDDNIYTLKVKKNVFSRIGMVGNAKSRENLYFIADEGQEIPKDKTIISYYVFFDEECYDSSYETYVKYYGEIYHVLLYEEGICRYLTNLKTDEDYVDTDDLNEAIKEHFGFDDTAEFMDYWEMEEMVW